MMRRRHLFLLISFIVLSQIDIVRSDKEECLRSIIEMKMGYYPDSTLMNMYSGKGFVFNIYNLTFLNLYLLYLKPYST